jgi:REP element-mobilizing transposase RayT
VARPWRIEYPNALYHVFSCGNERRAIVKTAEDRMTFIRLLGRMAARYAVDLFGYVLMPNEYDLLLRTRQPNLAQAMHWIGTAYTRRYNLAHLRSGHLFQGRYQSRLVEDAQVMAELSCHIHFKPVRRLLASDPADYPWSSYGAYAFGAPLPVPVDAAFVLDALSGPDRRRAYREMAQRIGRRPEIVSSKLKHRILYGSRGFLEQIRQRFIAAAPGSDITGQRRLYGDRDPRVLLAEIAAAWSPEPEAPWRLDPRAESDLQMYLLSRTGFFRHREIGTFFGLSHSAVSRRIKSFEARLDADRELADRLAGLRQRMLSAPFGGELRASAGGGER